ncbi:MAG: hypothetical protein ABI912_02480 [Actinomycetota bacterium]
MHATVSMDDGGHGWLTLYAAGTHTWQPAIGSMPLPADHEIPEEMPSAALVVVDGPASDGCQPGVSYDGFPFMTTGPLRHQKDEPDLGVGSQSTLSGRFRVLTGQPLRFGKFAWLAVVGSAALNLFSRPLGRHLLVLSIVMLATGLALVLFRRLPLWRAWRSVRESAVSTTMRAVVWHAVPRRKDLLATVLISLYPLDAVAGAPPVGTVRSSKALPFPIPYADEVVVRGQLTPNSLVAIEHAGGVVTTPGPLLTELAPMRAYQPPQAETA